MGHIARPPSTPAPGLIAYMEMDLTTDSASLVVRDLTCSRYDELLFKDICFELQQGQLLQIEGENGSGKTTLLKTLCGFIEPDGGEISWCGQNIREVPEPYHADLNYLGHSNGIKPGLTCLENLRFSGALAAQILTTDIDALLEKYGLYGYQDTYAYSLSAGQRRRLALARLSLCSTRLWILDEPFTSLDEKGRNNMKDIFYQQLAAGGLIIMTSHDLDLWDRIEPVRLVL